MGESMDLFGKALTSYYKGSKEKFYFVDKQGVLFEHPLDFYFRSYSKFSRIEKKIINLSYGEILDIGCGTGNITQYVAGKGNVTGIDISANTIALAKMLAKKSVGPKIKANALHYAVADIFSYSPLKKFDTILLMENNLGMGQSMQGVQKLLRLLSGFLKDDGQILTNARIINTEYYEASLASVYGKEHGPFFGWMSFNEAFFKKLCDGESLRSNVLMRTKNTCLFRITKKS